MTTIEMSMLSEQAPIREEPRPRRVFDALRQDGSDSVAATAVTNAMGRAGLGLNDPRLEGLVRRLDAAAALGTGDLDFQSFCDVTSDSFPLVEKAVTGGMVVPDFETFRDDVRSIFALATTETDGKVADYIPQLGRVDPEQFGVSICTIDGQRIDLGDARVPFCLQSTCKPFLYSIALEEHGEEKVHTHVGREPSGQAFNELVLDHQGLPHNPLINAGAIMSCAMIGEGRTPGDRFDHVTKVLGEMAGGVRPGFNNPVYLSERRTADRNFAIGYSMRERGAFPENTDLVDTLEFYFQCCSVEMDAEGLSVVVATLANGGICPLTGRRVFRSETVRKCLSLMSSCGLYDFSGEWAFAIGLPAKSGVSGCILVVVPNVMGICLWSPRLDRNGNSVRGIRFCRELVKSFNFHAFDILADDLEKHDPRLQKHEARGGNLVNLLWAASAGDLDEVQRLVARGVDLDDADYDGRRALHLAASEGHAAVVDYLLLQGVDTDPRDRWGNTPLDDARREGHETVAERLVT